MTKQERDDIVNLSDRIEMQAGLVEKKKHELDEIVRVLQTTKNQLVDYLVVMGRAQSKPADQSQENHESLKWVQG